VNEKEREHSEAVRKLNEREAELARKHSIERDQWFNERNALETKHTNEIKDCNNRFKESVDNYER